MAASGKFVHFDDPLLPALAADAVRWIARRIDDSLPLVAIAIPASAIPPGATHVAAMLLSRETPLVSDDAPDPIVDAPPEMDLAFEQFQQALAERPGQFGLAAADLTAANDLRERITNCILDWMSPDPWKRDRFASTVFDWPATWPDDLDLSASTQQDQSIRFFLASCQYPSGLVDGTPRYGAWMPGPADASLCRLAKRIDAPSETPTPRLLILSGDQIYADATAGVFDPRIMSDRLAFAYERLYRSRGALDAFSRIPTVMLLDDHEIRDNWEPEAANELLRREVPSPEQVRLDESNDAQMEDGRARYWSHQRVHSLPCPAVTSVANVPVDRHFKHDGADFLLLDTRTRRCHRTAANLRTASIIDATQVRRLHLFLRNTSASGRPRFIDTPSVLLPRHRVALPPRSAFGHGMKPWASALRSDAWDGYPRSLHRVLAHLADHSYKNVVFLSGDEHISFVTTIRIQQLDDQGVPVDGGTFVRSIHSSGLYAPYPFANSDPADLEANDEFDFQLIGPGSRDARYRCTVRTAFFDLGPGYVEVHVERSPNGWRYRARFSGERGVREFTSQDEQCWS